MTIVLTAIDPQGHTNEFRGDLPSLEAGFDFLSRIVGKGHTLLKAYIQDGNMQVNLPLAAFDGLPLSVDILALQGEWQAILAMAYYKDIIHEDQVWLARQFVHQCDLKISHHQRMLSWASDTLKIKSLTNFARLTDHYERLVDRHQKLLVAAQLRLGLRKAWLDQLLA